MTFGFDEVAGTAADNLRRERDQQVAAAERSAAEDWEERRELTRHFIEAIRAPLQVVYARLVSEGISPKKSKLSSKSFLRTTHEQLIWIGGTIDAGGFANNQYGPFFRYINSINKNGDFFWTDVIEYRRPGVHNDGGLNDIGRIERPFSREVKPPRNAEKRVRSNAVFWSDRSDSLEFTAYYIARSICSVPSPRNGGAAGATDPIVVDRSDGSVYFRWAGTDNRHRDDEAPGRGAPRSGHRAATPRTDRGLRRPSGRQNHCAAPACAVTIGPPVAVRVTTVGRSPRDGNVRLRVPGAQSPGEITVSLIQAGRFRLRLSAALDRRLPVPRHAQHIGAGTPESFPTRLCWLASLLTTSVHIKAIPWPPGFAIE